MKQKFWRVFSLIIGLLALVVVTSSVNAQSHVSVFFQAKDGTIHRPDANNVFRLSPLDEGRFQIESSGNEPLPLQGAYFSAGVDRKEGINRWQDVWLYSNGVYNPHDVRTVEAKVYDKDPLLHSDAKVLNAFFIQNESSMIEELKMFVDGKEVSQTIPAIVSGTESKKVVVKGRKAGKTEFIDIPTQALYFKSEKGSYIGLDGTFLLQQVERAPFVVEMRDGTVKTQFVAEKKKVIAQDFTVEVPKIAYIEHWNALSGSKFIGINEKRVHDVRQENEYELIFTPKDVANRAVKWEALTPEIADFEVLHGNGIVPKKAGVAKFLVTSMSNPELKKEVSINFQYKSPLTHAELTAKELTVQQYETLDLDLKLTPTYPTEPRFVWTYSQANIVEAKSGMSRATLDVPHSGKHQIVGKNPGVVTVTGTPIDMTNGVKPVTFKVTVTPADTTQSNEKPNVTDAIKHGVGYLKAPDKYQYGDEWSVFTIGRANRSVLKENKIKTYLDSVSETLSAQSHLKTTDIARVVLALGAIDKDPTAIAGQNLIEKLYQNNRLARETSNAAAFTLIALDSKQYKVPDNALWTREKIVEELLKFQAKDGSFSLAKGQSTGSVDMTAMSLQALAPYYHKVASESDPVKQAVKKGLSYLKQEMNDQAGYGTDNVGNSASTAQVLTALTALNIDPLSVEYTKGPYNMVNYLNQFKRDSGYATYSNGQADIFGGTQVTYALNAYDRFVNNRPRLYDFSDSKQDEQAEDERKTETTTTTVTESTTNNEATREEIMHLYDLLDAFERGVELPRDKENIKKARDIFNRMSELDKEDLSEESVAILEAAEKKLAEFEKTESSQSTETTTSSTTATEQPTTTTTVTESTTNNEATREEIMHLYDLLDAFERGVELPRDKENIKKARDIFNRMSELDKEDLSEESVAILEAAEKKLAAFEQSESSQTVPKESETTTKSTITSETTTTTESTTTKLTESTPPSQPEKTEMIDVYVSVEGYNLGQGYYVEPMKVSVPKGSTAEDVTRQVLKQLGKAFHSTGTDSRFYLSRIEGIDKGTVNPPSYITDTLGEGSGDGSLGEFDYTSTSGWIITVNHEMIPVSAGAWKVKDKDVIRWQFTVQGLGADTGVGRNAMYEHQDKTELTRLLMTTENVDAALKQKVLAVLINPLATKQDVAEMVAAFSAGKTEKKSGHGEGTSYTLPELKVEKEVLPYTTIRRVSDQLKPGEQRVVQAGKNGQKLTFVEVSVDKSGNQIRKVIKEEVSEPIQEIIEEGAPIKEPETKEPEQDNKKPETKEPEQDNKKPETKEPEQDNKKPEMKEPEQDNKKPETKEPEQDNKKPETKEPEQGDKSPQTESSDSSQGNNSNGGNVENVESTIRDNKSANGGQTPQQLPYTGTSSDKELVLIGVVGLMSAVVLMGVTKLKEF